MSFIYPRTIQITRPNPTTGIGPLGYQNLSATDETVLFTGIPASVQQQGGTNYKNEIPANTKSAPVWNIFIPLNYVALGTVDERDIVTDDLGNRYQVSGAYWNSLGHKLECELLLT